MEPTSLSIVLHPLVDLSHACPPFFVHYLLEAFTTGIGGKSGSKFVTLRHQLVQSLPSAPPPGPATFVVKCLRALLYVRSPHDEGLSHLLISALSKSDRSKWSIGDASVARTLAASLFSDAITGEVQMESRIVVKLPALFGIELKDIGGVLDLEQCSDEDAKTKKAKEILDDYVLRLLKDRSYTSAVSLLKSFNLQRNDYEVLVAAIADDGQTSLAVEWAAHLGKEMLKFLVGHCIETGLFKVAYRTAHQYNLEQDFPGVYYLYRQSTLRKLVNKGLWDVAESIAEDDPQLVDYLLNLALEDNDVEKITELCERFHLDQALVLPDLEKTNGKKCYLELQHFVPEEKVYWIDDSEGLHLAERQLIGVKIVGIDCEWKANRTKGVGPNKVSILQVASSESVFIFDLLILSKKHRSTLNGFVQALFHTPDILKLGYAIHNDFERLMHSYKEVEAFRICESVLDLQRVFDKEMNKGGLSGLAKSVLGNCLNKQTRMSDWECRPLSKKQLHYAALDAAVLLPIYNSIALNVTPASPKLTDLKEYMMSFKVVSRLKEELDDHSGKGDAKRSSGHYSVVHSHEDLVLESCELLGNPIPGYMKAELFQFTQAAKLPAPVYAATSFSFLNATAYLGTVKVAGTTFSGRLFSSKKDAEFSAAQVALTKLNQGLNTVENTLTNSELQQRRLQILQACGCKSSIGCARIEQQFKIGYKSKCVTGSKFAASASPFELSFTKVGHRLLQLC